MEKILSNLPARVSWILRFFATYVAAQSLLRLLNMCTSLNEVSLAVPDVLGTFLMGFLFDLASGVFFALPLAFLLWILSARCLNRKIGRGIVAFVTLFLNTLMVFSLVALYLYWQEFHTNFNFVAVDYLVYTQEMIGQIRQSFPVEIILPAVVLVAALLTWWQMRYFPRNFSPKGKKGCLAGAVLLILLPMVAVTVPKDVWREKVSENVYNVELSGNGPYGFVYAFFHNSLDYNRYYLEEDESHVREYLRNALSASNVTFTGSTDKMDVTRRVENRNALTDRKPNVVLITVQTIGRLIWTRLPGNPSFFPGCMRPVRVQCAGWKQSHWPCPLRRDNLFCAVRITPGCLPWEMQ
jgi:hypothetical protein